MTRTVGGPLAIVMTAVLVAGCSGRRGPMMANPAGPSGMTAGWFGTYTSNGERIYFTATSASGAPISYNGGIFVGMGRMACVTCHGPDGHGGSTTMMGALVQAPNITWPVLTSPDPDMEHPPFTEQTVKNAIANGVDPAGHPLDQRMPRWTMTPADLDDLVGYLKTLR